VVLLRDVAEDDHGAVGDRRDAAVEDELTAVERRRADTEPAAVAVRERRLARRLLRVELVGDAFEGARHEHRAAELDVGRDGENPPCRRVRGRTAARAQDDAVVDALEHVLELRREHAVLGRGSCRPGLVCLPQRCRSRRKR
jgi:hypothetical protein